MKVDYIHKDTTTNENIRKDFSDKIYPTMVIRSQAETIELQEKEIERLNNIIDNLKKYQCKRNCAGRIKENKRPTDTQVLDSLKEWLKDYPDEENAQIILSKIKELEEGVK